MPLSFINPFLLAAVAVVAIGVVIYELVSNQEERCHGARGRGGRRPSPPPGPDPPDRPSNDSLKPSRPPDNSGKPPPPTVSPKSVPSNDSRKPPRPPNDSRKPPRPPDNSGKPPPPTVSPKSAPSNVCESTNGSTVGYSNASRNNLRRRNFDHLSNKENYSANFHGARGKSDRRPPPPPGPPHPPNDSRKPPRPSNDSQKPSRPSNDSRKPSRPPNDSRKSHRPPNYSRKPPCPPDNSGKPPTPTASPKSVPSNVYKTTEGSTVVHSNAPGNNLRRRNFDHLSNKENYSANFHGARGKSGRRPPRPPNDSRKPPRPPNDSRKPPRLSNDSRKPSRSPNDSRKPPHPPDNSRKPLPPTSSPKSVPSNVYEITEGSTVVHSNAPGNNLRRRNFDQLSNKENYSANLNNASKDAPAINVKKTDEIHSTSSSKNSPDKKFDEENYSKNMLNKLTTDAKNINKNIKYEKFLGPNIYKEESSSSESNEEKLINRNDENIVHNSKKPSKHKRKSKQAGLKSAQNITDKKFDISDQRQTESNSNPHSDDSVTFASTKVTKEIKNVTDRVQGSQSSNLYPEIVDFHPLLPDDDKSSSCSDEGTYKEQLLEKLKNDVHDSKENHPGRPIISSPKRIKEEKPIDFKICRGCEENHVNTWAYPCNHSYLCTDCAVKVFRLSKKCAICLADVEEFLQFAS